MLVRGSWQEGTDGKHKVLHIDMWPEGGAFGRKKDIQKHIEVRWTVARVPRGRRAKKRQALRAERPLCAGFQMYLPEEQR